MRAEELYCNKCEEEICVPGIRAEGNDVIECCNGHYYCSHKCYAEHLESEVNRLNAWVADLQEGTYINCVYCGHRYPPGTPEARDKVLYEHITHCPKHPLTHALATIELLKKNNGKGRVSDEESYGVSKSVDDN